MDPSLLKCVFISSKRYKKELLINQNEVSILYSFIKNIINNEVMILNTNLGLDIYYLSSIDCKNIIENSFFIITTKKQNRANEYRVKTLTTLTEISNRFFDLSTMPIAFTCYSKNLVCQLKTLNIHNKQIVDLLLKIWQKTTNLSVLNALNSNQSNSVKNLLVKNSLNPIRNN
ncbi:hypothetical protein [Lutibacter sp. B1]|uniref:hypothetical protein n=1 Tax=Lutibacter sp. B1 TaxID=2725996 RepID=UPI00145782EA|nr:hypothetical protein [Lutibacter sp. B1]NLP58052.1 hypothetical protein [Lutibacter sp. B1]